MKAIILAGGKGTRLLPLTSHTPKPLIEINGVKIIDRILNSLPGEITEVVIVVEHLKEKIKEYIGSEYKNIKIHYADQIEMRGTMGALLSARNFLEENERFLVLHGDDVYDKSELEKHIQHPRSFGIQKMHMPAYHNITRNNTGHIDEFKPQTDREKENGAVVATGSYCIDTDIFSIPPVKLRDGEYGLPQTLLMQKNTHPIMAIITEKWLPINSFEDKDCAEKILKNNG